MENLDKKFEEDKEEINIGNKKFSITPGTFAYKQLSGKFLSIDGEPTLARLMLLGASIFDEKSISNYCNLSGKQKTLVDVIYEVVYDGRKRDVYRMLLKDRYKMEEIKHVHSTNAILKGDNVLNFENWNFPQLKKY